MSPAGSTAPLLLLPEVYRRVGGIQTCNRHLVAAFGQLFPEAPPVTLVQNDGPADAPATPQGGRVSRGFAGNRWRFAAAALEAARRERPALILLGHRHLLPLTIPLRALGSSPRWLLLHGIEADPPLKPLERLALRGVDRVLAVSPQTADAFARAGGPRAVSVWPLSLPPGSLPLAEPPRLRPPFRLLTVARLAATEAYKGVDDAIDAVARLRRSGWDVGLDVAGDGDDRPRLEAHAASSGAGASVRFHGEVDADCLERLYVECDVFVLPSRREGFGLVYIEAMAHARPVVAAAAGGAVCVVQPDHGGRLVPPGDPEALAACLEALLRDPEAARAAGLAGRRLVEQKFTFEALVERTRALLRAEGIVA